ncbi:MAG: hypothetical protein IPN79_05835 [Saprospiraceae bacterium]|nr:hypothetical protein [Saprospiraceae bacterium]
MTFIKYSFFSIFIVTGILFSCDKNQDKTFANATINFFSPTTNTIFKEGDTIKIEADISADVSMHGYKIYIFAPGESEPQLLVDRHTHGTIIYVRNTWIVPSTVAKGNMKIEIIALVDHEGQTVTAQKEMVIQ